MTAELIHGTLGFCGHCKKPCGIKWTFEEVGVGFYEYFGHTGHHSEIQASAASDCCGADVYDDPECECDTTSCPPEGDDESVTD